MTTLRKTIATGTMITLMLVGITAGVRGQVGESGSSFGPGGAGTMQIKGKVICVGCSLAEVRQAQNNGQDLYQLTHKQGRIVMHVSWVSNSARWGRVAWPPQLWVRGEDKLLRQLNAEENLFKELEITGSLSSSRTLDISAVTIHG